MGNVSILDTAQAYSRAVKLKKSLIVILATLFGNMLSVAFLLVRAGLHKGVESSDKAEALDLPVYACIPIFDWQAYLDSKMKHHKRKKKIRIT